MGPIHAMDELMDGQQWMAMVLGGVLSACVALSVALVVVLCGGGKKDEPPPKDEAPPAPGGGEEAPPAPAGDAPPPAEEPKKSAKEAPAKEPSQKCAPSQTTGPSAKGPELKLTSEKPAAPIGGKSAKGGVDLKKQPSLVLHAGTAKKK